MRAVAENSHYRGVHGLSDPFSRAAGAPRLQRSVYQREHEFHDQEGKYADDRQQDDGEY